MLDHATDFWERVTQAKEIMASDLKDDYKRSEIASLEPEPDSTLAYQDYLSERFKGQNNDISIDASLDEYELAREYLKRKEALSEKESALLLYKNKFLKLMLDGGIDVIDFGSNGKITNKANKTGTRSFRFSVKNLD
jgi:hypothetical protein